MRDNMFNVNYINISTKLFLFNVLKYINVSKKINKIKFRRFFLRTCLGVELQDRMRHLHISFETWPSCFPWEMKPFLPSSFAHNFKSQCIYGSSSSYGVHLKCKWRIHHCSFHSHFPNHYWNRLLFFTLNSFLRRMFKFFCTFQFVCFFCWLVRVFMWS